MNDRTKTAGGLLLAVGLGLALASGAQAPSPGRFASVRVTPRLLLVTDAKMNNTIAAVRTSRGLVIVDTGETVEAGRAVRAIIEREFPGEPFAYVINTHSHWDHVLGNPAFSDATIVAHEGCRQSMMKVEPRAPAASPEGESPAGAPENPVAAAGSQVPPPPPAVGQVGVAAEFLEATLPDVTFTDRTTLHCGDRTFRLAHFGNAHTTSDIIVHIPEDKTLFVGDLFFKGGLPGFNEWLFPDVARWRAVLGEFLRGPAAVQYVVSGHGGTIPPEDLAVQVRYALDLWDGLSRAFGDGLSLEDARRAFAVRSRYPGLEPRDIVDSRGRTVHDENIRKIWHHLTAAASRGDGPCTDDSKTI